MQCTIRRMGRALAVALLAEGTVVADVQVVMVEEAEEEVVVATVVEDARKMYKLDFSCDGSIRQDTDKYNIWSE